MTLIVIVLVTALTLAFFSQAMSWRQIEDRRGKRVAAEIVARSGCDYVIGQFLSEIADPTHSTSYVSSGGMTYTTATYAPKTSADSMPRRMISSSIGASNAQFFNLIRQSVQGVDTNASGDNTASPAKNGRAIQTSRWNQPLLLSGTGFASNNQLPNWIYLDKSVGATNATSPLVIGRFAYNVYDVGGLLNVNAAGAPSACSGQLSAFKGSPAGADLTALGLAQGDIDSLVSFRNPKVNNTVPAYTGCVSNAVAGGFLLSGSNDYIDSRLELLSYVRNKNPALTSALPYLTHFSKSLAAPSWMPSNPNTSSPAQTSSEDYETAADAADSANRRLANVRFTKDASITHYRDDGTTEPVYSVKQGDPLLQRRFSLAKLAWLTPTGPAQGISGSAIQACFGLAWNAGEERWDYVGPSGNAVQSSISVLDAVASDNREPNYFELLKAGVLDGSVGQVESTGTTMAALNNRTLEGNGDLQILRIGANIIDCAGADNYPTRLAMNFGGSDLEVAGVCDLPYLSSIWTFVFQQWNKTVTPAQLTKADLVLVPILLNPHRPALVTGASPSSVTVDVSSGILTRVDDGNNGLLVNMTKDLSSLAAIQIPSASYENFRSVSGPATEGGAAGMGTLVPYADSSIQKDQGFRIYSYENEAPTATFPAAPVQTPHAPAARIFLHNLVVRLRYSTPNGQTKTYETLAGNEALPVDTGIDSHVAMVYGPAYSGTDCTTFTSAPSMALWDPRTNRLGPNWFSNRAVQALPPVAGASERLVSGGPFNWNNDKTGTPIYYGMWPQGGKMQTLAISGGNYTNLADPDGIFRPADAWLGSGANLYYDTSGSMLNTASKNRPILLHRPYQTVAELGYVFRDSPWKTLDFFDETSADGALLDLFCVADEPRITDGRASLLTRQALVLQSILQGTGSNPDGSSLINSGTVAGAFESYCFDNSSNPNTVMPKNLAQIPSFMSSTQFGSAVTGINKYTREASARALSGATQTRTWDLFVDVIAQSGRFTGSGTSSGDFQIEGESHYWLSVAIDRYTGKVIAKQLESVNE